MKVSQRAASIDTRCPRCEEVCNGRNARYMVNGSGGSSSLSGDNRPSPHSGKGKGGRARSGSQSRGKKLKDRNITDDEDSESVEVMYGGNEKIKMKDKIDFIPSFKLFDLRWNSKLKGFKNSK